MRLRSESYTQTITPEKMDVVQADVENKMLKHHVRFLIHGHTHKPDIHTFSLHENQHTRIVLGAWHKKGNALIWDASGEKKLIEFAESII